MDPLDFNVGRNGNAGEGGGRWPEQTRGGVGGLGRRAKAQKDCPVTAAADVVCETSHGVALRRPSTERDCGSRPGQRHGGAHHDNNKKCHFLSDTEVDISFFLPPRLSEPILPARPLWRPLLFPFLSASRGERAPGVWDREPGSSQSLPLANELKARAVCGRSSP
ncbi:hypothetical protein EYF80_013603 [Liparis tanakae]|uniref:Uncharacterized protein n=1 Tax=Liparis tanakae TaxID=230148 RepID=A0A4Z2IFJ7_9TELE|nr:hypothetical protein EYF80_013603 [Liparis tanakae]